MNARPATEWVDPVLRVIDVPPSVQHAMRAEFERLRRDADPETFRRLCEQENKLMPEGYSYLQADGTVWVPPDRSGGTFEAVNTTRWETR